MADDTPRRASGDPMEQTGYRVSASTRKDLVMAQAFLGHRSLQAVLDVAVEEFLGGLREKADGFGDALENAERFRESRKNGETPPDEGADGET